MSLPSVKIRVLAFPCTDDPVRPTGVRHASTRNMHTINVSEASDYSRLTRIHAKIAASYQSYAHSCCLHTGDGIVHYLEINLHNVYVHTYRRSHCTYVEINVCMRTMCTYKIYHHSKFHGYNPEVILAVNERRGLIMCYTLLVPLRYISTQETQQR